MHFINYRLLVEARSYVQGPTECCIKAWRGRREGFGGIEKEVGSYGLGALVSLSSRYPGAGGWAM